MNIQEEILPLPAAQIAALKNTPQNPRYHAEGDVYAHTCMVLVAFEAQKETWDLTEEEQLILYWVCVLHDIGKPLVTHWKKDRWTAKGHERAGVAPARDILLTHTDLTSVQRQRVLDLVRWHHIPLRWGLEQRSLDDYRKLATQVDLRLLGLFATCDMEGRLCERKAEMLALIASFNKVVVPRIAYELGAGPTLQTQFRAAHVTHQNAMWRAMQAQDWTRLARLLEQTPRFQLASPAFQVHCIMCLNPQPGKAWGLERYPTAKFLDLRQMGLGDADQLVHAKALRLTRHFISVYGQAGNTLIMDGMPNDPVLREELTAFLRLQQAEIHLHFWETPLETLLEDQPEAAHERLTAAHAAFAHPHPWEFHQVGYND